MKKRRNVLIAAVLVAGAVGVGTAAASASDNEDENEVPITGEALERASSVALEHTGEGRVTDTEEGDEDSYYEVEVTLDDGSEIDIQLDRDFAVVGEEAETDPDDD